MILLKEDDVSTQQPSGKFAWHPTSAQEAVRHDDIWFVTRDLGWAVNSNGEILRTADGGGAWDLQHQEPGVWLRCVGFASESRGWVGTVTPAKRLLETHDGGTTWTPVDNLPQDAPPMICGLAVVSESVVYASGTNYPVEARPDRPPAMMTTSDGGATWTAWTMEDHASLLVDTYFTSPSHGWVVGGKADQGAEPGQGHADHVRAVVLQTEDGGQTWVDRIADLPEEQRPLGEWGWKIQFVNDRVGFVSLESDKRAAILRSTDGGETWQRLEVNDRQQNKDIEGVGFVDETRGWVGGWGPGWPNSTGFSSGTDDGGHTWRDANEVGRFINRFRFLGDPVAVGYASGRSIYKYSAEPPTRLARLAAPPDPQFLSSREPADSTGPVNIGITVPMDASRLTVNIWERFGEGVRQLVDEPEPAAGSRTVEWDVTNDAGERLDPGTFILRVTVDDRSESRMVRIER